MVDMPEGRAPTKGADAAHSRRLILAGPSLLPVSSSLIPVEDVQTSRISSLEAGQDFFTQYVPPHDHRGEPLPAVLLVEEDLPGGGLQLLRWLRQGAIPARYLPAVFLLTAADPSRGLEALATGANSVVALSSAPAQRREQLALLARYWLDLNIPPPDPCEIFQR